VLWQNRVRAPLKVSDLVGKLECHANVQGGGISSQAGAVMLGLARALLRMRPDLEAALRDAGYLTRDSRMVERKKYGHKKARKSFQFSKR
jgi:small subunit ribosomal protein S9